MKALAIVLSLVLGAACTSGRPGAEGERTAASAREVDATIYYARERLEPLGATVRIDVGDGLGDRIWQRFDALRAAAVAGPGGSFNVVRLANPSLAGVSFRDGVVFLDFTSDERGWGLGGPGQVGAFVQQLTYTVTDEPDVRALVITVDRDSPAVIEGVRFAEPLTRANVLPRPSDPATVWFARERGAPLPIIAEGAGIGATPAERIRSRIVALVRGPTPSVPEGTFNVLPAVRARLGAVTVEGDLATVDFAPDDHDWGLHGAAAIRAFIRQVVFTATEEPGIARVLITDAGGRAAIGDEGLVIERPITRTQLLSELEALRN